MKSKQIPFVAKRQQVLKHPSSYPIVKQTVSSENVRCVVESLRDEKYVINTKSFDSKAIEQTLTSPIYTNHTADDNSLNPTQNSNKDLPITIEEDSSSIIENKVRMQKPLSNYSTINSDDNFVIIMDGTPAHVEIKYAKQHSPFPNEQIILGDFAEGEKTPDKHDSYVKANNRATVFKTQIKVPTNQSNIGDNMKTSTLHYSQRNQEQIMDLSLKDNSNVSNQKPIFTPCQKELSYVSKYHDHSFMQEHAYLESLFSTSLRNKQEMSNITRVNFYSRYPQLHSRNKYIPELNALRKKCLPSFMPSEVCSSSFTLDRETHTHPSDMMNCFPNQLYENYLKPEIYDFPTSPYNHTQQQKLTCVLQTQKTYSVYNLDLQQPLYYPLHQNLHYFPPQYRSKNSSTGLGPFENQQLCDVANPIPQFTFAEPKPTSLPPTPRIPDDGNPNNFPFSSPNLRNTLKKFTTPFEISPFYLNTSQPELSIKSEFLTDVNTPHYVPCPNTTLAEHMTNNFSTPELHMNTHPPHLRRNYI
ncbi:uncharacterized protein LOC105665135 [Ceratitis capitata]|nr:uncharacterized protein LOC105665135 [Ceratitis capitata]